MLLETCVNDGSLQRRGLHGEMHLRFRKLQDTFKRNYHSTVSSKI